MFPLPQSPQPSTDRPSRGESGVGTWTVIVRDTKENQYNGSLIDWSITLWGEVINADKAELHPLPGEEGKHGKPHESRPMVTAGYVATTELPSTHPSDNVDTTGIPEGHPERPVNSKPTAAPVPDMPEQDEGDSKGLSNAATNYLLER